MQKITIRAKLVDYNIDIDGYITYVFCNLEPNSGAEKYIMCVRYPNWDNMPFKPFDTGFLTYAEIIAGEDTWQDTNAQQVPYKYTNIQFLKFILDLPDNCKDIVL